MIRQMLVRRHTLANIIPNVDHYMFTSLSYLVSQLCDKSRLYESTKMKQQISDNFCKQWSKLAPDAREMCLNEIVSKYGSCMKEIELARESLKTITEKSSIEDIGRIAYLATQQLRPAYCSLLEALTQTQSGVETLMDMRNYAKDHALDEHLLHLLRILVSGGSVTLQPLTWHSPCALLQQIAESEQVHPIRTWKDLQGRLGPGRRVFAFTHPQLQDKAVLVLHTALTVHIPSAIPTVLRADSNENVDDKKAITAVFYSISNLMGKGLRGIDLGTLLVARVLAELRAELPNLQQFSSLSPIPGFSAWCREHLKNEMKEDDLVNLASIIGCQSNQVCDNLNLKIFSQGSSWWNTEFLREALCPILLRLCAKYLYQVKRRGYAFDAVAHFHLRNGAVIWRLNWAANLSPKGLQQSFGIMVNYRYYPEFLESNAFDYVQNKSIRMDSQVSKFLNSIQSSI